MRLALDTDTAIEALRGRNEVVVQKYIETNPTTVVLPSMVAGELLVGALKSVRPNSLPDLEGFLGRHAILPFGEREMREYARIRARLESAGTKIGPNDLIVAATALAAGATLVTHNGRELSRVPGLSIVDWQE